MQKERLIEGVRIVPIKMNLDNRGLLAEVYREEWNIGCETLQWNAFYSCKNAFRGIRVHSLRIDYVILIRGTMTLCLHDIRPTSKTQKLTNSFYLSEQTFQGIIIPPGVAHGFYFHEASTHLIGISHYHDPNDEISCIWNSPEIDVKWPITDPILSKDDAVAPPYKEMLRQFNQKNGYADRALKLMINK